MPSPDTDKVLYHCREVSMVQNSDNYYVRVNGNETTYEGTLGPFGNPLEAWRRFVSILDDIVCHRIYDMFERQGRNQYTGEVPPCQ